MFTMVKINIVRYAGGGGGGGEARGMHNMKNTYA